MADDANRLLCDEHRGMVAAADDIVAAVTRTPRAGMNELSALRARLSSLLLAHLQSEEDLIFDPLARVGGIQAVAGADAVVREVRDLRAAYSAQVRDWHPRSIEADWPGYGKALAALVERLKALVIREESSLYRPALRLLDLEATEAARLRHRP